jgi:transposase
LSSIISGNIEEIIKNYFLKSKNKLIVLDNGQIHKKESTKNIINNSGNYLIYTCPYHPRLNSIEQWFSQVKHYMKLDKTTNLKSLKSDINLKSRIRKNKFY